jgi:hypothetical protein
VVLEELQILVTVQQAAALLVTAAVAAAVQEDIVVMVVQVEIINPQEQLRQEQAVRLAQGVPQAEAAAEPGGI